jgi:hypothetical protein
MGKRYLRHGGREGHLRRPTERYQKLVENKVIKMKIV